MLKAYFQKFELVQSIKLAPSATLRFFHHDAILGWSTPWLLPRTVKLNVPVTNNDEIERFGGFDICAQILGCDDPFGQP